MQRFREIYFHYDHKPKSYERLANSLAPLIVESKYDAKLGARVVGICGKYTIIRQGMGPPLRGVKVITSYNHQGSTLNHDWFEAVELAQGSIVDTHKKHKMLEERAKVTAELKTRNRNNKKSRAKRVKQSRRKSRSK